MKTLSIQIPTITGREKQFNALCEKLKKQAAPYGNEIEIISIRDNKQISIGAKRKLLYERANALYSWQIDDDDDITKDAIDNIMKAAKHGMDCITFMEKCIFEDYEQTSNFSINYKEWADNYDGYDHVRTPFHKTPIKTALCLKVGVKDLRYGEDHQFAKDIKKYLKTEYYISDYVYIYRYKFEEHKSKFGIV